MYGRGLMKSKNDPLKNPSITLLVKLGSIVVHIDEMLSDTGHHFDIGVIQSLLLDSEVKLWIAGMSKLALLPTKRGAFTRK